VHLGTSCVLPPISLDRILQVLSGEDRKSRSSNVFLYWQHRDFIGLIMPFMLYDVCWFVIGHILLDKNHFIVMMLFNRDFAIQKCFQKILHSLQVRKFGSLSAVRTTCHLVRTPNCPKHHSSRRRRFPSGRPSVQASSVRTT